MISNRELGETLSMCVCVRFGVSVEFHLLRCELDEMPLVQSIFHNGKPSFGILWAAVDTHTNTVTTVTWSGCLSLVCIAKRVHRHFQSILCIYLMSLDAFGCLPPFTHFSSFVVERNVRKWVYSSSMYLCMSATVSHIICNHYIRRFHQQSRVIWNKRKSKSESDSTRWKIAHTIAMNIEHWTSPNAICTLHISKTV